MNCINCGAPPRRGARECIYCETPLDVRRPDANEAGFRSALRAVRGTSFDNYKVDAARHLVPLTLNRSMLLDGAELFDFDNYRADFIALVGYTNDAGQDEEPAEERRVPVQQVPNGRPPWGLILLALVAVVFIFKTC